jgi:NAD+ kinase
MSRPRTVLVDDDGTLAASAVTVVDSVTADDVGTLFADDPPACDAVVTLGERAFTRTARATPSVPVLPVAAPTTPSRGIGADARRIGGPAPDPAAAVDALATDRLAAVDWRLLSVAVDGEPVGTATLDAGLVTSEPARISEYSVVDDDRHVETVRSDGVVVSTPLGSDGYGRAAGGPVLAPGTGLAVTPIAPFATATGPAVLNGPVHLRVERDEGGVSLLVDDEVRREVPPATRVTCAPANRVRVLHLPDEGARKRDDGARDPNPNADKPDDGAHDPDAEARDPDEGVDRRE